MSAISPDKKAIVQELLKRRDTLAPDKQARVDELGKRLGVVSTEAAAPAPAPATPSLWDTIKHRSGLTGAVEFGKGVSKGGSRMSLGAFQWAQDLPRQIKEGVTGETLPSQVTPTPMNLEPENPAQSAGIEAVKLAPAFASGGASLPVQAGVGAMTAGAMTESPSGAIVGGVVPVVGQAVAAGANKLLQKAVDKEFAAKLWNRVAKVKGGRQGNQLDMKTGEFKTLPGRSMVDETQSPLSQVKEAFFAKPNLFTQKKAFGELSDAGKSLGGELAKATTRIDVAPTLKATDPLAQKRLLSALEDVGLKPQGNITKLNVTPTEAHKIQSALGERVNWNPNVMHDGNEELKEMYFALARAIEGQVPNISPFMKRWQESYLFNKALQSTMEKAASQPFPRWLKTGLKTAGIAGAGATGAGVLLD